MMSLNRTSKVVWTLIGLLLMAVALSYAQEPPKTVATQAQAKAMARRAAIEDGYRQLAETIYGIRLDAYTTVRNFVTENDVIYSRVRAVIAGARVVDTEYMGDGTCKVKMELRIRDLQKALRKRFPYSSDRIRVIGVGVLNPVEEPTPIPAPPPAEEEWEELIISATGKGVPPEDIKDPAQRKLMAERAAFLDAVRQLGENIQGVYIDSKTTVRDFVTQSDEIRSKFEGWIKGAKKTMVRELPDGTVEVDVELELRGLRDILHLPAEKPAPHKHEEHEEHEHHE